ncbi:hypothetical protein CsNV_029 [Callinectes sapidus nudivirus]|nr:hypothetical protein CsNV_029 [Callinectes sapidus nudivirus]
MNEAKSKISHEEVLERDDRQSRKRQIFRNLVILEDLIIEEEKKGNPTNRYCGIRTFLIVEYLALGDYLIYEEDLEDIKINKKYNARERVSFRINVMKNRSNYNRLWKELNDEDEKEKKEDEDYDKEMKYSNVVHKIIKDLQELEENLKKNQNFTEDDTNNLNEIIEAKNKLEKVECVMETMHYNAMDEDVKKEELATEQCDFDKMLEKQNDSMEVLNNAVIETKEPKKVEHLIKGCIGEECECVKAFYSTPDEEMEKQSTAINAISHMNKQRDDAMEEINKQMSNVDIKRCDYGMYLNAVNTYNEMRGVLRQARAEAHELAKTVKFVKRCNKRGRILDGGQTMCEDFDEIIKQQLYPLASSLDSMYTKKFVEENEKMAMLAIKGHLSSAITLFNFDARNRKTILEIDEVPLFYVVFLIVRFKYNQQLLNRKVITRDDFVDLMNYYIEI